MAINAFAGERENHTLETLLATRLSDQAILFGKVAAGVVYSLLYVATAMIAGLITTNLATAAVAAHGDGRLLMYSPVVGLGGLAVALLAAGVTSAAGVLASLRAATVRAAGQKLILMYLALAIPYFIIGFLPGDTRAGVIEKVSGTNSAMIVLVALNVGLNAAAISRFQRSQLILD